MARHKNRRSRGSQSTNQRLRFSETLSPFDAEHQDDFFSPADQRINLQARRDWLAPNSVPVRTFSVPTFPKLAARPITQPSGRSPRVAAVSRPVKLQNPEGANPRDPIEVCVQRHQRKEVLHALKKTGKGGQRRPTFTLESFIRCRRR